MKKRTEEEKLSIFISLILRHKPEIVNVELDMFGYTDVNKLIEGINNNGQYKIDFDTLNRIVKSDEKGRYSFNSDKTKIRANQGHSCITIPYKEIKPPKFLYHGTSKKNFELIKESGINKMKRSHVHLSNNIKTANRVGLRHGEPVVLVIDTEKMLRDGYKFYISKNEVYLTDYVPVKYIKNFITLNFNE